ncbi:uncharacterized protein LOC126743817 [Anthonomus grandis grandis]|uniref:uncharacterized protein LOC126743817 n=1 Tax=Anthonomus grandis grandis TaxID=2921223 RepID=UPI00216618B6|nr:uncharacterized protein LOC126743817 [Anthonomus grandis grandis]
MPISNQEAFNMLAIYFECLQNATIAARAFYLRYPNRPRYHRRVFVRLAQRLLTTGSIHRPAMIRNRQNNEQNVVNVLASVEINPQISTREISRDLGIPQSTVHRILRTHRLHPYHINLHQALSPPDFDQRLDFCHWLLSMIAENPQFLSTVLRTDEATFNSNGHLNLHNMHFWARNNPRWLGQVQHQGRYSVNVWCGIIGGRVVGPYILDGALNGLTYLHFLENVLPILMEDIALNVRQNMFFQHDGCPAHYALAVRQYLDATFPDRWIERGSLFPWAPRQVFNTRIFRRCLFGMILFIIAHVLKLNEYF